LDAQNHKSKKDRNIIKISRENHIHRMSADNKPCITVDDGSTLLFDCWDALEGRSREYFEKKTPHTEVMPNANPATGPVFIKGAMPGDALEIEINNIKLVDTGFIQLSKNQFIDNAERESVLVETEIVGDQLIYDGRKFPVQPMVGVIGVAGLKELWCQEVGNNGSNMDTRIIKKGSIVLLPVAVEGALLAIGDAHAVMGDGEVFGQGVEIASEVEVTVRVRKDVWIQRPVIINPDRIACVASNPNVLSAKSEVVRDMGKYLVEAYGFSSLDAGALIAFYGNLHFSQVANPQKTVRLEIENRYIKLFKSNINHD
jgi:amidase